MWWLVSLALCGLAAVGLTDAGYSPHSGSASQLVLWGCLFTLVASLVFELWRDAFQTAKYIAWLSSSTALFAASMFAWRSTQLGLWVAVGCVVVAIACFIWRVVSQRDTGLWADVLAAKFALEAIHEVHGVQFAGTEQVAVNGGASCDVELVLQNCVDAERRVKVVLTPEAKVPLENRAVLVPEAVSVTLAPGQVERLMLTCVAVGRASGQHPYAWQLEVQGPRGKRLRKRRAAPMKVPLLMELVSIFSALSLGERGRRVFFAVTPGRDDVVHARPSSSATTVSTSTS